MSPAEVFGIVGAILAFLLAPLLALVSWTFVTFRSEANRAIEQLRDQNRDQALQIATIKAAGHDERMVGILEKLQDKLDGLGRGFERLATVIERLDRKMGTSGEYRPVIKSSGSDR